MAMTTPPRPLSPKEFKKAWKKGKRTMKEIDPKLYMWRKEQESMMQFKRYLLIVIAVIYLIGVIILSNKDNIWEWISIIHGGIK
jgi:hypothetical protein